MLDVRGEVGDCNPKGAVKASQVEVSVRRKTGAVQSREEEEVTTAVLDPPGDRGVSAPPIHCSRLTFLT